MKANTNKKAPTAFKYTWKLPGVYFFLLCHTLVQSYFNNPFRLFFNYWPVVHLSANRVIFFTEEDNIEE